MSYYSLTAVRRANWWHLKGVPENPGVKENVCFLVVVVFFNKVCVDIVRNDVMYKCHRQNTIFIFIV